VWQSGSPQPGEHWDAVIDLDCSAPPLEGVAFYAHWPIEDGPAPETAVLVALADLVNDLRRGGKRVLIHCAAGINRSGLLAAAALIRDGMEADEAVETVRARRPGVLNNPEFVRQLIEGF
jgi:protein-tyrosine phosphatase